MTNKANDYKWSDGEAVDQMDLPWQSHGTVDLGNFNTDPEPENTVHTRQNGQLLDASRTVENSGEQWRVDGTTCSLPLFTPVRRCV